MLPTLALLRAAAGDLDTFPRGAEHFLANGELMPADDLDILRGHDAFLFASAGHPAVSDERASREFVSSFAGPAPACESAAGVYVSEAATAPAQIDLAIVRENSEREYAVPGGELHGAWPEALAVQSTVMTRAGGARIARPV